MSIVVEITVGADGHLFRCGTTWTAKQAKDEIRSEYLLIGGGLKLDGLSVLDEAQLDGSGKYAFVGAKSSEGKKNAVHFT